MEIPKGHQGVMPYLMLTNTNKFIEFTQKVFSASETFKRLKEDNKTIMHAEIQISGSTIMFCDATEQWKPQAANLFVYVAKADDTYQKAIDNGATNVMEPANMDYGRSCGVIDPFGNIWWITSVR